MSKTTTICADEPTTSTREGEQGAEIYRHDFLMCPCCGEQSGGRVDHLYDEAPREFGPWYCKSCGMSYCGKVIAHGDVEAWPDKGNRRRSSRSMALLKFGGKDGPVFFVMDHDRYYCGDSKEDTDEANQEHQRYFFEEHSCPTNWLHECVAVIEGGDPDPHGFLSFVRAVDVPQDFDADDDENWPLLFPVAFGGTIIDGEVVSPAKLLAHGNRQSTEER